MRNGRRQQGNAALEYVLILPIIIAVALICSDLYRVNQARSQLEQSAHTLASVLAQQSELDENGIEALIEQVASPDILGNYELVVNRVQLDRSLPWEALVRGRGDGLCTDYTSGGIYAGDLPEEQTEDSDSDDSDADTVSDDVSMIVVQLCRNSSDLELSTGILDDKVMQAMSVSRMAFSDIDLDDALAQELGVDEDDEDDDATL